MGFNFVYAIKDSFFLCNEVVNHFLNYDNNNNNDNKSNVNRYKDDYYYSNTKRLTLLCYRNAFNIMSITSFLYREKILLRLQQEKMESIFDFFSSKINHSAHIQGFLFGSSIAVLTIWRRVVIQKRLLQA
jgi:hypothetical protein